MSQAPQTLILKNDVDEIPRLAEFVDSFCRSLGPAPKALFSLHVALEEAVTNVIRHGYQDGLPHRFTLALMVAPGGRLKAILTDDAPPYDPMARPPVDTSLPFEQRPIGGLGVHLVKTLMDSVRYERRDGNNILTMELAMKGPSSLPRELRRAPLLPPPPRINFRLHADHRIESRRLDRPPACGQAG